MIYIILGIGFLLLVQKQGGLFMEKKSYTQVQLNNIYKKYADMFSLDWKLLRAIAFVESSENPYAVNPSDPSYGLMQILFPNNLPSVNGWPPDSSDKLYDPDYNVYVGSQILAWNIKTYGFQRGIATYNNWSARKAPEFGPFPNEEYVHRVLTKYSQLREINTDVPNDIY